MPPFVGMVVGTQVSVMINRPEPVEEMMVTKNKYFDKHDFVKDIVKNFLGNSIVFAKSDMNWQAQRKALGSSLYKEKLRSMIETIKKIAIKTFREKWVSKNGTNPEEPKEIDIIKESAALFIQITLETLFGIEHEQFKIKQSYDGVEKMVSFSLVLQEVVARIVMRNM